MYIYLVYFVMIKHELTKNCLDLWSIVGTSLGAPCLLENELAQMIVDAVPSVDMVRFTNSEVSSSHGLRDLDIGCEFADHSFSEKN